MIELVSIEYMHMLKCARTYTLIHTVTHLKTLFFTQVITEMSLVLSN